MPSLLQLKFRVNRLFTKMVTGYQFPVTGNWQLVTKRK